MLLVTGLAALGLATVGFLQRPGPGNPTLISPTGPIEAHNSPTVARNPLLADNVVVSNRVDRPGFSAVISSSFDNGRSWAAVTPPLPDGLDRPFAPDVAFGPDGSLFALYANLTGPGNVPESLWMARSLDGGRNFGEPVRVTGEFAFQGRLAIDAMTGRVYVTYLQADQLGLLRFDGEPPRVMLRFSDDGGRSFSDPLPVSDNGRRTVGAAVPVVSDHGDLAVVFVDFNNDVRDFENQPGPPWTEPFHLVVRLIEPPGDLGPEVTIDDRLRATRRFLPFLPDFPSATFDAEGTLHVAWADGREGDLDVFHSSSPDGGLTWGVTTRVNDNPAGDGTSQYLPAVDVTAEGRVDILFYDRRVDPADVWMGVTLASSRDPGDGFANHALSTVPFDSRVGSSASTDLEVDFGARIGIESSGGQVFAVWTDTRLGDQGSGRQDVVGRVVEMAGVDPWVWFSGSAAALLAGLALYYVSLRRRP